MAVLSASATLAAAITGMIFDANGVRTGTFAPNIGVNGSIDQLGNGNLVIASESGGRLINQNRQ